MPYRTSKLLLASTPTVLSIALSFWNIRGVGLSHWDEYSYVTTAKWFLGINGAVLTIYEPPVFPLSVAVFYRLFGVLDYVAIATSATFAIMTVLLVAYLGARMFNLEVGLVASLFLAVTPLFLIYSRMALTDMAFTFFYTASVAAIFWAFARPKLKHSLLAGLIAALCVMTKYNGFMALMIPLLYLPITLWGVSNDNRRKILSQYLRHFFIMIIPSFLASLLFIDLLGLLGISGEVKSPFGRKVFGLLTLENLRRGFNRFQAAAVQYHAGQLSFVPFSSSYFFLQVLLTWVPIPILLLTVIGVSRRRLRHSNDLFASYWLILSFILISSIPAEYSRAILPSLPPLSLVSAVGLMKLKSALASLRIPMNPHVPSFARRHVATILIIALVLVMSSSGAIQAVSDTHASYREVGKLLDNIAGKSPVLAETQPVLAFYHQVDFGLLSDQRLNNFSFLVVDFVAINNGYGPTIAGLESKGRIKLVAEVPSDIPSVVYLDSTSFDQLQQWSHSTIQIYRVLNSTSTQALT